MIKKIMKGIFILWLLSFTPLSLVIPFLVVTFYDHGSYLGNIKVEVSSLWDEMIDRYDLHELNLFLLNMWIIFVVFSIFLGGVLLYKLIKYKRRTSL